MDDEDGERDPWSERSVPPTCQLPQAGGRGVLGQRRFEVRPLAIQPGLCRHVLVAPEVGALAACELWFHAADWTLSDATEKIGGLE